MALSTIGELRSALEKYDDRVALAIGVRDDHCGEWNIEDGGECGIEIIGVAPPKLMTCTLCKGACRTETLVGIGGTVAHNYSRCDRCKGVGRIPATGGN